jgi:hexosaminidase
VADWNRFMNTVVQVEFPFLEKYRNGYYYRIPPPGILAENAQIKMNTAYPGFQIRYTLDGSEPTAESPLYEKPIPDEGKTVRAACFNSSGRGGLTSTYKNVVQ